ncbi:MAG: hypothetical protein QW795_08890 [Candidatus Bathyarchaeia archaeon]
MKTKRRIDRKIILEDEEGRKIIRVSVFDLQGRMESEWFVYKTERGEEEVKKITDRVWETKYGDYIVFVHTEIEWEDEKGRKGREVMKKLIKVSECENELKDIVAKILREEGFTSLAEKLKREYEEWKEREREKERKRWEEERRKQIEVSEKLKQMMETIEYKVRTKMIAFWNSGAYAEELADKENKEAEGKTMTVTLDAEGNKAIVVYDEQGNILAWKLVKKPWER